MNDAETPRTNLPAESPVAGCRPVCGVVLAAPGALPGRPVDRDALLAEVLLPAIARDGFEPWRAEVGPAVDAAVALDRLALCAVAVIDVPALDAKVAHAVGVRDGLHGEGRTLLIQAVDADAASHRIPPTPTPTATPLPARAAPAWTYRVDRHGRPVDAGAAAAALADRLLADRRTLARTAPLVHLLDDYAGLQRLKTDVFRDSVGYDTAAKAALAAARAAGLQALQAIEAEWAAGMPGGLAGVAPALLVDLLLSYRAVGAHACTVALVARLASPLAATTLVQEQLGLALNRLGCDADAQAVLQAVIDRHGASSETCALLGRVHKDRYDRALDAGDADVAAQALNAAIDAYRAGFEADWRDAFPGVNALTLMALRQPPDPRADVLLPVVAYAVERRIAGGAADYFDHASRLELGVLGRQRAVAATALVDALAAVREAWEPASTARNLRLIGAARARRGECVDWADDAARQLDARAAAG